MMYVPCLIFLMRREESSSHLIPVEHEPLKTVMIIVIIIKIKIGKKNCEFEPSKQKKKQIGKNRKTSFLIFHVRTGTMNK